MKKLLIVVSHPDDEVLGAGGLILSESKNGVHITLCILSKSVNVREYKPSNNTLHNNILASSKFLGINKIVYGDFPNIKFNTIPHLQIVKFIENIVKQYKPDSIITHHPSDLNIDHQVTSHACQVAFRITQRQNLGFKINLLLYMEILSSSEWNINPSILPFIPNYYYPFNKKTLESKLRALDFYVGVMRPSPHPRSQKVITSLAILRGSQICSNYAEAFQIGMIIYNS